MPATTPAETAAVARLRQQARPRNRPLRHNFEHPPARERSRYRLPHSSRGSGGTDCMQLESPGADERRLGSLLLSREAVARQ